MDNKKINYDSLESSFLSKYKKIGFCIILIYFILVMGFLKKDYYNLAFFLPLILFLPFIPNYFFLKTIKCPSCNHHYFTPFLAGKDDIKTLLKSNPKCVNCGYEAEITSEYKTMY